MCPSWARNDNLLQGLQATVEEHECDGRWALLVGAPRHKDFK